MLFYFYNYFYYFYYCYYYYFSHYNSTATIQAGYRVRVILDDNRAQDIIVPSNVSPYENIHVRANTPGKIR